MTHSRLLLALMLALGAWLGLYGGGDEEVEANSVPVDCSAISPGLNEDFVIAGVPRTFYVDIPADVDAHERLPVVFNWHGLGQSARDVRDVMADRVDDPDYPFIAVTPEDTDHVLETAFGEFVVDWDVFDTEGGSKELELFDAVVSCLDENYGVDHERVHSVGISLGGIVSDYLGHVRGGELASVATYSGAYWSNPENQHALLRRYVQWPEEAATQADYAQLIAHGGESDRARVYDLVDVAFDRYAERDAAYLRDRGHHVVLCDHGEGHGVPEDLSISEVLDFFAAHPKGAGASLPASLPSYCG